MRKISVLIFGAGFFLLWAVGLDVGAQVDPGQTAGGIVQQERLGEKTMSLERRIAERREHREVVVDDQVLDTTGPNVLVTRIEVEGATLISEEVVRGIVSKYEGKELSLRAMQRVADLITDQYRLKGYATSRAYIPPQTMQDGVLIIRVVEGRLGEVQFRGNRYFKTSLLEKKIDLEPQSYFDYSAFQRSMVLINEHPDRVARAFLVPGREPGTTDVVIDVEDNYPFHAGFEFDNYGSRFIGKERYAVFMEHNNLLGFDDKFYMKVMHSDSSELKMFLTRYVFPVTNCLNLGGYFLNSRTELGDDLKILDAGGKARIYGIFANKTLIAEPDLDVRLNAGFDYKSIKNELAGVQSSKDDLRVLKAGFDIDKLDTWGRNIFTAELNYGLPGFWNGSSSKDPDASRAGAGGAFQKGVFNYYRLQPMPMETSLLWKNSAQYTNHNLTASEQFQIGGPTSVRGYPAAENSGDNGYYTSLELSLPFYGLSKDLRVPYRQERMYDALRWVLFYDFGRVTTKTPGVGEEKSQTLKGWGFGMRVNVSDDFAFRVEVGYPIGKTPSDNDHAHPWVEFVLKF